MPFLGVWCVVCGRCVVQKWHFNDTKQHKTTQNNTERQAKNTGKQNKRAC